MSACGKCGLPINPGETGLRHFGFFRAHSEARCLQLLRLEVDRHEDLREAATKLAEAEDSLADHNTPVAVYEAAQLAKLDAIIAILDAARKLRGDNPSHGRTT